MNYKSYRSARNAAWELLVDQNVNSLPVRTSDICRRIGIAVKYYDGEPDSDGRTEIVGGMPLILVSKNKPVSRQRFTVAHELGHIILGHIGNAQPLLNREPSAEDGPLEQEANVFAARLLTPACVLWGCGVKSAEDIARLCQISRQSAEFRWDRIQLLYQRNKF